MNRFLGIILGASMGLGFSLSLSGCDDAFKFDDVSSKKMIGSLGGFALGAGTSKLIGADIITSIFFGIAGGTLGYGLASLVQDDSTVSVNEDSLVNKVTQKLSGRTTNTGKSI